MPILNPLKFVETNPTLAGQYNYHHLDDYLFQDQFYDFEERKEWQAPWQNNDIIKLQFESNFSPIQLTGIDCNGYTVVNTLSMNQVRANRYVAGYFVYEASISLTGLIPDRIYSFKGLAGAVPIKSEPFRVASRYAHSLYCEYYNTQYHGDVIFETGIVFSLRIPGYLKYNAPGTKSVVFEDQVLNDTVISARTFRNWTLFVGEGGGVPPWFIDKINEMFTCDNVTIDGKQFTVPQGSNWTEYKDDRNNLVGYSIQLRETINRRSKRITDSGDPNKKVTLIYNIDSPLMSDLSANAGTSVTQILDTE